jgi:TolB-like protein/Flp pilus assembly protein TadD
MATVASERRLVAILAADVAGYSALMERDEEGTLARLKDCRAAFETIVAEHRGRVFGEAGDSLIAAFDSPVEAVRCAQHAQQALAGLNASIPRNMRLHFRIGINLGDVIAEGGDFFGDSVNIAARLQALAEPGGVLISAAVRDMVAGKIDASLADLGAHRLRNITRPVRVFRLDLPRAAPPPPDDKPSIAVLAFDNLSGDASQDYFSDGVTEDIITELSRFRTLFVTARNSSFAYRGKPVDVKRIGRELGVAFVVEGSVRRAGDALRITAQLVDAVGGHHLWAERYDCAATDLFTVQDDVTRRIVAIVANRLDEEELGRSRDKPTSSLKAYDLWLRGVKQQQRSTPEGDIEAKACFEQAIAIDPEYARAYAGLAEIAYLRTVYFGWGTPEAKDYDAAIGYAQRAVALDDSDAAPHSILGWIHLMRREFERARRHWDRAIVLNPNDADILMSRATALAFLGEAEEAIAQAKLAMRLNPFHPDWYDSDLAVAYFCAGRYGEVIEVFDRIAELFPHTPAWRAAAAAYLGRNDAADHAARFVGNIRSIWAGDSAAGPREYAEWLLDRLPFRRPSDAEHLCLGLRRAGLPI